MFRSVITFLLAAFGLVHGIPNGFILDVQPGCGATNSDDATITITTDMDISAVGLCKNSPNPRKDYFATTNNVHYTLTVKPSGSGSDCIFYQKVNSEVYTIVIEIAIGEANGNEVQQQPDVYIVTCTYDKKGVNIAESTSRDIIDAYVKPQEIQENMGTVSTATFTLSMIDVLNRPITTDVPIGRYVGLKGTATGTSAAGLRVVSCLAVAGSNSYAIIRGGCGDGVVFNHTMGFKTTGLTVKSPWFKAFKLDGDDTIQFTCNFTECASSCNGSSCTNARKRRDVALLPEAFEEQSIQVASPPLKVKSLICNREDEALEAEKGLVIYTTPMKYPKSPEQANLPDHLPIWVAMSVLGTMIVAFMMTAVYLCLKQERLVVSEVEKVSGPKA